MIVFPCQSRRPQFRPFLPPSVSMQSRHSSAPHAIASRPSERPPECQHIEFDSLPNTISRTPARLQRVAPVCAAMRNRQNVRTSHALRREVCRYYDGRRDGGASTRADSRAGGEFMGFAMPIAACAETPFTSLPTRSCPNPPPFHHWEQE